MQVHVFLHKPGCPKETFGRIWMQHAHRVCALDYINIILVRFLLSDKNLGWKHDNERAYIACQIHILEIVSSNF